MMMDMFLSARIQLFASSHLISLFLCKSIKMYCPLQVLQEISVAEPEEKELAEDAAQVHRASEHCNSSIFILDSPSYQPPLWEELSDLFFWSKLGFCPNWLTPQPPPSMFKQSQILTEFFLYMFGPGEPPIFGLS